MSSRPIIIVTGASRGVGLGIAQTLFASKQPYELYLTSTSGDKLPSPSGDEQSKAHHVALDISDPASVEDFASQVEAKHGKESIDALINNAGVNLDPKGFSVDNTKATMATNFYGTANMCKAFLPLIKPEGRIVNVASVGGKLKIHSPDAQNRFKEASKSLDGVTRLAKEYESLLEQGQDKEAGFAQQAYSVSKAFTIAFTKAYAKANPGFFINCCCPGWVDTDMGNLIGDAPKSLEEGAKIPVRLAVGKIDNVTGEFWENPNVTDTGDGKVSDW